MILIQEEDWKKKKEPKIFSIPTYYTAEFVFLRRHFNSQDTLCFGVSYLN